MPDSSGIVYFLYRFKAEIVQVDISSVLGKFKKKIRKNIEWHYSYPSLIY